METLVVLALLGLVATLLIGRAPTRSPTSALRQSATQVLRMAQATRSEAIWRGVPVAMQLRPDRAPVLWFYPDGSSSGGEFTLQAAGQRRRITVDWLTGRAQQVVDGR